ncbi:unnamed protein product [Brugia timori]|uniref:DDE_Tnp_1_7 domain-containing protein n=1 Tax=Brugia timori TaxID=42155 RepID=A0A0R3RB96_9BILA|nr:unnamed protein product [Brugia timori]
MIRPNRKLACWFLIINKYFVCYLHRRSHDSLQRYLRPISTTVVRTVWTAIATNIIDEVPYIVTDNFYTPNFIRPRKPHLKIPRYRRLITTGGGIDVLKNKFCPVLTTHFCCIVHPGNKVVHYPLASIATIYE